MTYEEWIKKQPNGHYLSADIFAAGAASRDAEIAELQRLADEVHAARKVLSEHDRLCVKIAAKDAEIAEFKAQQCTSPFADSPPCRGIQRERDTIAELVAALERAANRIQGLSSAILEKPDSCKYIFDAIASVKGEADKVCSAEWLK